MQLLLNYYLFQINNLSRFLLVANSETLGYYLMETEAVFVAMQEYYALQ